MMKMRTEVSYRVTRADGVTFNAGDIVKGKVAGEFRIVRFRTIVSGECIADVVETRGNARMVFPIDCFRAPESAQTLQHQAGLVAFGG